MSVQLESRVGETVTVHWSTEPLDDLTGEVVWYDRNTKVLALDVGANRYLCSDWRWIQFTV